MREYPLNSVAAALWVILLAAGVLLGELAHASPQPAGRPEAPVLDGATRSRLIDLPALRGPQLSDASIKGRVVVVTFFASWCAPCRTEMVHLKEIYGSFRERGLEIIAVNLFEDFDGLSDQKRLSAYLRIAALPFPVVKGNAAVSRQFGDIKRIPTLFVFDRSGQPAFVFSNRVGGTRMTAEPARLRELILALL